MIKVINQNQSLNSYGIYIALKDCYICIHILALTKMYPAKIQIQLYFRCQIFKSSTRQKINMGPFLVMTFVLDKP